MRPLQGIIQSAVFMVLLLLLARLYHPVAIADFPTSVHTHVETTGKVTLVKREADGDLHIRISDGAAFIVAEGIPEIPVLARPKVGQCVTVKGIRRFDNAPGHGWWEVHPIEALRVVTCK